MSRHNLGFVQCCFTCVDYEATSQKSKQGICGYHNIRVHMCEHCNCYSENQKRLSYIESQHAREEI